MGLRYIVIACLMLAGCSSLSYKEPVSGERARVRFASQSSNLVVIRAYDDASCSANEQEWMRLRSAALVNSSPKRMGLPLWRFHDNGAKELYVDATKPFHGLISSSDSEPRGLVNTVYSCGVPVTFQFKADSDYEVEFVWDRQICKVLVNQISGAAGAETLTHLATFTNRPSGENAQCLEAFRRRLY